MQNLAGSRVYLSTGNGVPDPSFPFKPEAWTTGVALESLTLAQNTRFDGLLTLGGVQHVTKYRGGIHDWPYWRRELPAALAWDPFQAPPVTTSNPISWTYRTMQPRGNAWGIGTGSMRRRRRASPSRAPGSGSPAPARARWTISPGADPADASGNGSVAACTFRATLPFVRTLPAGC